METYSSNDDVFCIGLSAANYSVHCVILRDLTRVLDVGCANLSEIQCRLFVSCE